MSIFDKEKKKYIEITAPDMVREFCKISKNTFSYRTPPVAASEGVDLADMLIELHRTKIITKMGWHVKLIFR